MCLRGPRLSTTCIYRAEGLGDRGQGLGFRCVPEGPELSKTCREVNSGLTVVWCKFVVSAQALGLV